MYIINKFDINENPLLLCSPVWSHAYCRWYERRQPRQVKTPAPPRSCDEEPIRIWPRGGSWCSSEHCPGKRLFCIVDNEICTFHQDCTATVYALQIHCVLYTMLLSSFKTEVTVYCEQQKGKTLQQRHTGIWEKLPKFKPAIFLV